MSFEISGLFLIDKSSGFTSHDAVALARRASGIKRIGHSGTLDPMATGLLILLAGTATKFQQEFTKLSKVYSGVILLGVNTDTWDMEGKIIKEKKNFEVSQAAVDSAVKSLSGEIVQDIPAYSAAKKNGVPLYKLARNNMEVPKLSKNVNIEWLNYSLNGCEISFTIKTSSGAYVRSLAFAIGEILGTGACLKSLRRLSIGQYNVNEAFALDKVKTIERTEFLKKIIPL